MQAQHFDTALAVLLQRVPFRPFTIVLVNGAKLEVDHPGAIMTRAGVAFFFGPVGVPVLFDHEGVNQFIGDLANQPSE